MMTLLEVTKKSLVFVAAHVCLFIFLSNARLLESGEKRRRTASNKDQNKDGEQLTEEMVERMEERVEAAQADQKNLFLIVFQVIILSLSLLIFGNISISPCSVLL